MSANNAQLSVKIKRKQKKLSKKDCICTKLCEHVDLENYCN